jgi:hypothetical protein
MRKVMHVLFAVAVTLGLTLAPSAQQTRSSGGGRYDQKSSRK